MNVSKLVIIAGLALAVWGSYMGTMTGRVLSLGGLVLIYVGWKLR